MLHLCPQVPQLDSSVLRLVQVPLQHVAESPEQIFPQVPQLPLLVEVFTHTPLQVVPPLMKHAFDTPIPPRVQVVPTEVVGVVVTAAVVVTGAVVASVGTFAQVDALQIMPAGHILPQMPQLVALDASS
jgi:hypothetical protein